MSIERKAISALKWATVAKLVVQIASWAGTLVVVRLLTPEDYGLMAKVAVVCAIAGAVAELGLGAAIVRSVDMTREDLRKICGVSLLFGAGMTTALVVAAPLLASLFQEPQLAWPIAGASLQIIVGAVAIVPVDFRNTAVLEHAVGDDEIKPAVVIQISPDGNETGARGGSRAPRKLPRAGAQPGRHYWMRTWTPPRITNPSRSRGW